MDPVTVAGLALSASSLALQVFEGVRKGFEIFETASHAEEKHAVFQLCLHMQYARVRDWGIVSGVSSGDSNRYSRSVKHNAPVVISILYALERHLKQLREYEVRWSELNVSVSPNEKVIRSSDLGECGAEEVEPRSVQDGYQKIAKIQQQRASKERDDGPQGSVPKSVKRTLKKLARATGKVVTDPSKLKWAVRDAKTFQAKLDDVVYFVNYLHETVSDDQLQQLDRRTEEFNVLLLQLTTSLDDIKTLLEAGHVTRNLPPGEAESRDPLTWPHGDVYGQRPDSSPRLVSIGLWKRAASLNLELLEPHVPGPEDAALISDRIEVHQEDAAVGRRLASLSGDRGLSAERHPVWIEWRRYETHMHGTGPCKQSTEKVQKLVRLLRAANKQEFACVPKCVGYFDAGSRQFGLVYAYPTESNSIPPRTLLQWLSLSKIALEIRFSIARRLASWLVYLMAVNWMHKGLRSASVLFFESSSLAETTPMWITEYTYSRPSDSSTTAGPDASESERAPYIHPRYLRHGPSSGYRKSYDIYSLGIVMIEIGFWRPILDVPSLLLEAERRLSGPELAQRIQDRVLEQGSVVLKELEVCMGTQYAKATEVCLRGPTAFGLDADCDQTDGIIAYQMQEGFMEKVVHVLDDMRLSP